VFVGQTPKVAALADDLTSSTARGQRMNAAPGHGTRGVEGASSF